MSRLQNPAAKVLQVGTVARINPSAGFGYVRDTQGAHQYIFVLGDAINRVHATKLRVGKEVKFHIDDEGRIDELVLG